METNKEEKVSFAEPFQGKYPPIPLLTPPIGKPGLFEQEGQNFG